MSYKSYEINWRIVFAMRLLGIGLQEINLFCGLMDIGKRLNHWIYYNCLKNLYTAAQAVYILSTKTSLDEKKEFSKRKSAMFIRIK